MFIYYNLCIFGVRNGVSQLSYVVFEYETGVLNTDLHTYNLT